MSHAQPFPCTTTTSRSVNTPSVPATMHTTPLMPKSSSSPVPVDIDSNHRQPETHTCYNCGKPGHISPQCPEPQKERVCANITDAALVDLISESISTALKAWDAAEKETMQTPVKKEELDF